MSALSSYFTWQPCLESRGTVASLYLTRGEYTDAPEGDRAFFEAILAAVGLDAQVTAGDIKPFVSRYFTGAAWEECWQARILLAGKAPSLGDRVIDRARVTARPPAVKKPAAWLPVRVLADFASKKLALSCRDALRDRAGQAKWNEVHYERYVLRDVGKRQKQLVVDVVTVERHRLQEAIVAAEEAQLICERLGGRTQSQLKTKKGQ